MRLLIVGSNQDHAIESYYIKYLREEGMDVHSFASADIVHAYRSKGIINKVLLKAKLSGILRKVNRQLINVAGSIRPDVILVFKGMELYPYTLKTLKARGFFLCNYNPDHPFILAGPGSGNRNVTQSVGIYDLHFCYNSQLQEEIKRKYNIPTVYLPFGYELSESDYYKVSGATEITKACFIGNPDQIRVNTLGAIADQGIQLDVYGHGWNKTILSKKANIQLFDAVYGIEFWKKLRQYRVQINIFRIHNTGSHNMRTFEIPAVGGIQLTPYSEEQNHFFVEGQEIIFYKSHNELIEKAKQLISCAPSVINNMRIAAREKSITADYSYKKRAGIIYHTLIYKANNGCS